MDTAFIIRNAEPKEFSIIGQLLVEVYSLLEGFPKPHQQPAYYQLLADVGNFTQKPQVEILVAVDEYDLVLGTLVYFGDMSFYGSGGKATQEKNAAGFRLLAVSTKARGLGIGKALTLTCIDKARNTKKDSLIIHSTKAMKTAWAMYEKLGFLRAFDLDFLQGELEVFGFRLKINN